MGGEGKVEQDGGIKDSDINSQGLVTRMILDLEKERKADKALQSEMLERLDLCPDDGFHDESSHDNTDEVDDPSDDSPAPLTGDQKFLKTVLEHVRHFVSMVGQPAWQLTSLSTTSCCLDLLARTPRQGAGEDQLVLLPLVHQVWHPLKLLFKSNNIFVVDKAFECLMVIARYSRDFVHRRTVTDVFPPLLKFFQTLQVMVNDRERHNTLAATQSRRILARLTIGVWDLLDLLDLQPLESDPLLQLILDHLGDKLRLETKEQESLLSPRRSLDSNILWLKLNHHR